MKKLSALWLAIGILVVLNIAVLSFIFFHKPLQSPPHGLRAFDRLVIQTLELDEAQQQQFDEMKREHHEAIMQLDKDMKAPVEAYFSLLLTKDTSSVKKEELEQQMATIYKEKLRITYRHFEQLKAICRPEQQQHFDKLIPELMQVMQPPPPRRDHHPIEE